MVRITDISNIKSALNLNYTRTSAYPLPDNWEEVTYSGWTVWIQWTFWKSSRRKSKNLDSVPLDPLFWNEYSYSVLNTQAEYELWGVFEWDDVAKATEILQEGYPVDILSKIGKETYAESSGL